MIVLADSSPLITLARAEHFELLREFYSEVIVSREVHDEIAVAGAGLPGAEEMRRAPWARVGSASLEPSPELTAACVGLGKGARSIIYLATALNADLVLIDEESSPCSEASGSQCCRFNIHPRKGCTEGVARLGRVNDLRTVFLNLLDQGIQ